MSNEKQRRRKHKARQHATRSTVDVLETPTGIMVRDGRFIHTQTIASEEQFAALQAELLARKPHLLRQMNERRDRILEILRSTDPVDLIARASLTYLRMDPYTYRESEHDRSPAHVEYLALQSLALSAGPTERRPTSTSLTFEAIGLVRSLFDDARHLLMLAAIEARAGGMEEAVADYQLTTRLNSLGIRGTGHAEHLERVLHGCFDPVTEVCRKTLGFTAADAIACVEAVARILEIRFSERMVDASEIYASALRELKRARRKQSSSVLPEWVWCLPPTQGKRALGSAPISVDFSSVRIWSSLEGSHHAQGIPSGVP